MIALDLTRLLSRAPYPTPTGIDRVEMAYAQRLLSGQAPYCFVARNIAGGIGALPADLAVEFIVALAAMWRDGGGRAERRRIVSLAWQLRWASLGSGQKLRDALRRSGQPPVYLLVSHQKLDRARPIARLKSETGVRFVCLIHDLIPLDHPALTRRTQPSRHRRRLATVAALADAVIVNSVATRDALMPYLGDSLPPVSVAPLGVDVLDVAASVAPEAPYFVAIGTIEKRKNLDLLLDVWEQLAEGARPVPRLILVGRRGLGGGRIAARLRSFAGLATERTGLSDRATTRLLRDARALLHPSLAEGFGLPVAEALALGVPVLCSDLPALRESGGGVPDYLDLLDRAVWRRAILDHTGETPRRAAQLVRLARWRAPSWSDHFAIVDRLIAGLG